MPNDPELLKLTPSQIAWCVGNMEYDIELEEKAMKDAIGDKSVEYDAGDISFEELMAMAQSRKKNKR